MARVALDRVGLDLGGRTILTDVSLDVRDGEFFCVIGPSGCGKSMLLRLVAGLERPTRGKVYFDDRDVTEEPPGRRDVAMVFQEFALYPHLNASENIGFALRRRRAHDDDVRQRVVGAAEELGSALVAMLDRMPDELSVGFQQRVALARAVVRRPNVFLLDEPLSALDSKVATEAHSQMRRLLRAWA